MYCNVADDRANTSVGGSKESKISTPCRRVLCLMQRRTTEGEVWLSKTRLCRPR